MTLQLKDSVDLQHYPGLLAMALMKSSIYGPVFSDINEDLWLLYDFACRVDHVTEFGVRAGISTAAFLAAQPRTLRSYDIEPCVNLDSLKLAADRTDFQFIQRSSTAGPIEPTDLLFIDSLHTYEHLKNELSMHHRSVSGYIILHDTLSCGTKDEFGKEPGLLQAQKEFCEENPQWRVHLVSLAQNGLTVLKRRGV